MTEGWLGQTWAALWPCVSGCNTRSRETGPALQNSSDTWFCFPAPHHDPKACPLHCTNDPPFEKHCFSKIMETEKDHTWAEKSWYLWHFYHYDKPAALVMMCCVQCWRAQQFFYCLWRSHSTEQKQCSEEAGPALWLSSCMNKEEELTLQSPHPLYQGLDWLENLQNWLSLGSPTPSLFKAWLFVFMFSLHTFLYVTTYQKWINLSLSLSL